MTVQRVLLVAYKSDILKANKYYFLEYHKDKYSQVHLFTQ
jgi:methyl coenzyme M reductase alpha subunit